MLRTRSPLGLPLYCYAVDLVRLACVKHAASVRPEPGSNSHVMWALVQKPSWKAEKLLISCWLYVCDTTYRLRLLRPKSKLPAHLVRSFFVQFSKVNRASRITWLLIHNITAIASCQQLLKIKFKLFDWWISNFHMITSFYLAVNNESYLAVALQKTTSQYYHHFKSMSNRFQKNPSDYRGTKLYHKIVSLVNASASTLLWIHHLKRKTFFSSIRLNTLR